MSKPPTIQPTPSRRRSPRRPAPWPGTPSSTSPIRSTRPAARRPHAPAAGEPPAHPRGGSARARHGGRLRAPHALPRRRTHRRYQPEGETARDLFEAMETARCEAMGARDMPGTAGNIDARIADEARAHGLRQITGPAKAPLAQAAGYMVRHLATGRDLPKGAQNVMSSGAASSRAMPAAPSRGSRCARRPAAFARFARRVIEDLGYGDQLGEDPDDDDETPRRTRIATRPPTTAERPAPRTTRAASRKPPPRRRPPTRRADPEDLQAAMDAADEGEMAEELDAEEGEAPLSAARPRRTPRPTRPTRSTPPGSTRRSPPRTSPSPPSSSASAPISTSSSSR